MEMNNSVNAKPTRRAYMVEFGVTMVAYAVVLLLSITVLNSISHDSAIRPLIALSPMIPGAFVVVAVVRQMGRMDELQRRMLLEALSIAFAGTALITFSYGFLENVGFPHISWFAVWPLMAVLWIVGNAIAHWRYR
jgi:peptidoglycan/LPS O-acetylase OafA/YrhL